MVQGSCEGLACGIGNAIINQVRKLSADMSANAFNAEKSRREMEKARQAGELLPPAAASAPEWKLILLQICLGVMVNLGSVSAGANLGFSAVALPQMRHPNATLHVTESEASWIASVAALSTPVGCLLSGWLLDRLGRRSALLWQNVPALLGWALIASSAAAPALPWGGEQRQAGLVSVYLGRILTGLATGMGSVPGTVYIAEVSLKKLRGFLVTWTSIAIALGILIVYVIGAALPSWRHVAAVCAVFPALSGILVYFLVVESPVWLVGRGRAGEAQASLMRVRLAPRNRPDLVQDELDAMIREHQQARARQTKGTASPTGPRSFLQDLRQPECWKPLVIMNLFFLFQQLSGIFVVIFYAVDIVIEAGITLDPYIVTVLIGLARLLTTFLTGFLSSKVGRRPLAIISGAGMTVCMLSLATHLLLDAQRCAFAGSWLPVSSLVLFILTSTLGFLTLPWAMVGEMFPARFRGAAGGFTTCSAYVYSFALVKLYPSMAHLLQRHGVFFFYGALSLVGTLFVALFLPETQGKTLQEVEDHFAGRRRPSSMLLRNGDVAVEMVAEELRSLTEKPKNGAVELTISENKIFNKS